MSVTTKNFPKQLASIFRVLGQPARLRIILALGEGEACVCHLESALKLRQAYLSQQLMALRDAGIVTGRREGRNIFYRLSNPQILDIIQESAGYLAVLKFDPDSYAISNHLFDNCACPRCSGNLEPEVVIRSDAISTLSTHS
jgi:DNA-binding transcriptional ArsR family regulator